VRSEQQRSYGGIGIQKMTQRMGINAGVVGQQVKVKSQSQGLVQMMKGLRQVQKLVRRSSQMGSSFNEGNPSRKMWRRMRRKHSNDVKQSGKGMCSLRKACRYPGLLLEHVGQMLLCWSLFTTAGCYSSSGRQKQQQHSSKRQKKRRKKRCVYVEVVPTALSSSGTELFVPAKVDWCPTRGCHALHAGGVIRV
jgi:hypothetical protein